MKTMTPLFTIRQIQCQYPSSDRPVLEIEHFDIHKGELIFFLGVSGVGKSTLIESLGLMNRTVLDQKGAQLTYHGTNGPVQLIDLWSQSAEQLSQFRAREYSFIFQSTNLFERVSLEANAIMPSLAGSQVERMESKAEQLTQQLLQNVTMEDYRNKTAGSISGGQKQRLAFIQAMVSSHEVLFGDEPTGNLDWGNAQKVMRTLRDHLHHNQKTGLVVSHDVHLSTAFADRIVLMTGRPSADYEAQQTGEILARNIFTRMGDRWTTPERKLTTVELQNELMAHFEDQAQ